jgi:hypothetical protein
VSQLWTPRGEQPGLRTRIPTESVSLCGTIIRPMEHWQRIANNLSEAGFSWGGSFESDSTSRVLSLQMHTLPLVAALLFWQTTDSPHFWNYRRRFIVNLNSDEVLCPSLHCAFSRLAHCLADA